MGRIQAEGFIEAEVPIEMVMSWHLTSNHYPPVTTDMVPVCIEAINRANGEEDWSTEIQLPESVSYRGNDHASIGAIINNFHLDPWLHDEG